MAQLRYWVWLTTLIGVRTITIQRLMERFGGPMEIFFAELDGVDWLPSDRAAVEQMRAALIGAEEEG